MIKAILVGAYLYGWLFISYPLLKKYQKLSKKNNPADDVQMFKLPVRWSKGIIKISGSDVSVEGLENIPADGAVTFVGNHKSYMDIFLTVATIGEKRPLGFIAKVELKKIFLVNKWMEVMGCLFLDRADRRGSLNVIRTGIQRIKDGHSIIVFPEGTRRNDDTFGDFKGGSLRLAKDGGSPVVPFVLYGTSDTFENNGGKVKAAKMAIRVLPAISNEKLQTRDLNEIAAEIKEDVMKNYFEMKALNQK